MKILLKGMENNIKEIIQTNCNRIKNDILTKLNLTNAQIVFRCNADSDK